MFNHERRLTRRECLQSHIELKSIWSGLYAQLLRLEKLYDIQPNSYCPELLEFLISLLGKIIDLFEFLIESFYAYCSSVVSRKTMPKKSILSKQFCSSESSFRLPTLIDSEKVFQPSLHEDGHLPSLKRNTFRENHKNVGDLSSLRKPG